MEAEENINFIFQLNNRNRSANFFVLFIASGVVFLCIAFYFVAVSMTVELILTIVIAVVYFYLFSKIKPSFFELLITEDRLQLNFYNVWGAFRNYQSIEFPLWQLKSFSVKKSFRGLNRSLVLSVKSKYGLADYPPVSLSILTKQERTSVLSILDKIINANQKA